LTAHHGLAHGVACGFTLPALLDFNLAADDGRIVAAARAAGCATTAELRARIVALLEAFGVDAVLRRHGIGAAAIGRLAGEMLQPGRADNNLRPATADEARTIALAAGEYLPALRRGGDV
jgi:alcohol dehydrogenase